MQANSAASCRAPPLLRRALACSLCGAGRHQGQAQGALAVGCNAGQGHDPIVQVHQVWPLRGRNE